LVDEIQLALAGLASSNESGEEDVGACVADVADDSVDG
jgi:hypothetical protein